MNLLRNLFILLSIVIIATDCNADDEVKPLLSGGATGIATALSRADVALANSRLSPLGVQKILKGDFGESMFEGFLTKSAEWKSLTARFGVQGLDNVAIKYDRLGRPTSLMVSEVKYGSGSLSQTKDGIQASSSYNAPRLTALGNEYSKAGTAKITEIRKVPLSRKVDYQFQVPLKNGKQVTFWKADSKDTWKFAGALEEVEEAQKSANLHGKYLRGGGEGLIPVRGRLVEVKKVGPNYYEIKIGDASLLGKGKTRSQIMKNQKVHKIAVDSKLSRTSLAKAISKSLKKKFPNLSKQELDELASKISTGNIDDTGTLYGQKTIALNSLKAAAIGGVLLASIEGVQQIVKGEFDPHRIGAMGGIGAVATGTGSYVGQLVTAKMLTLKWTSIAASKINVSTPFLSNVIGATIGAGVANAIVSYGLYFAGYSTLEEAHMMAAVGTVSIIAASLTSTALAAYGIGGSVLLWTPIGVAIGVAIAINQTIEYLDEVDRRAYVRGLLDFFTDESKDPFRLRAESLYPILDK